MNKTPDEVRNRVSRSYSRMLEAAIPASHACCGPVDCGHPTAIDGEPVDVPSFGCGDPLLFSNVEKGATVLDLGSGAGYDLIAAAARVGPAGRVIGVDMTDDMIEAARANVEAAGYPNIEVRKGLIEDLPVESSSVDWVISNCVINLSPEKERVFSEIARVLKPGGRFSISDICAVDLPTWLLKDDAAYDGCVAGAVSETAYVHGLRRAGLTEILIDSRLIISTNELKALASEAGSEDVIGSDADLVGLEGKIWSVRFTGRKP
jgi:SAM-dependent methyltransferase